MSFTIPTPTLRALSKATGENVTTEMVADWWRAVRHELPKARAEIERLSAALQDANYPEFIEPDDHVAAFERGKILEALQDSGKCTPYMVEHVLAGLPLAKLRTFAEHAIAVMPTPKEQLPFEDRNFQALASTAARFEDMPPAARVALQRSDPSTWRALHEDYISRGSPEPQLERLFGRESNGIPLAHGVASK